MMTQQQQPTYVPYPVEFQPRSNGLGVAGFVCSLLGLLLTGGLLCPLGLILSLVAVGRQPRGFAIAGIILGLLGTCGGLLIGILAVAFGLTVLLAMVGVFMFTQSERIELTADLGMIAGMIEQYKQENNGIAPADLSILGLPESTLNDPWGNPYRYILDDTKEPGFDLISDGQDKSPETPDDVRLSELDKYWSTAMQDFERKMEEMEGRRRWDGDTRDEASGDEDAEGTSETSGAGGDTTGQGEDTSADGEQAGGSGD